jgi:Tol biopolymer transport system component
VALTAGMRLGPYEIQSALGVGGMGEVYRATDTNLARSVAIKVLPEAFAQDSDRLARFEREARTLASLNHPNIAIVHGLEKADGVRALVMELVDGPTLADIVARGPLNIDEALPIARQIADALASAHENGIVHRDLKPANVKVKPDGTVKVLDFGLAKPVEAGRTGSDAGLTHSPTMTSPAMMSGLGVILGTAPYMSPEQARGKPVDARADTWAFGCVLYEMLTGRRAFEGEDVSETLAAVIKGEPDWAALPAATPTPIRRLLRRCLTKEPTRRISDASMARLEIDEALAGPSLDEQQPTKAGRRGERIALFSALAVATIVAAGSVAWALRPHPVEPEMRLEITTPPTTDPVSLAISPDGRRLAFVATSEGLPRLWVRGFDSVEARPLAGSEGAKNPFWSPDGRSLAFFADARLKRIDVDNGLVQTLANALFAYGGSWNRDGSILFSESPLRPVLRTTATGAAPVDVTTRELPSAHMFPSILPDGRHFLYYVTPAPAREARGVYVAATDGSAAHRLFDADSAAVYYAPGHLLFVRQGTLFAQAFDPVNLSISGDATAITAGVAVQGFTPALAASPGRIVYRAGSGGSGRRQLAWFDRSGREIGSVGPPETNGDFPSLSPGGDRIVLSRTNSDPSRAGLDIWMLDIERNVLSPFVVSPAVDVMPLWSRDGDSIVFTTAREIGRAGLYVKPVRGTQGEKVLLETTGGIAATDWSPDGRFLLYQSQTPKTGFDLLALPMTGDKTPVPVATGNADERSGQFSPDGKWVAYQSNESGRDEIWVQSFPDATIKERVTGDGGGQARWRRDGKELFYLGLDERLMAVQVSLDQGGKTIRLGTPAPLFRAPLTGEVSPGGITRQPYEVSADGQRFLINKVIEEVITTPITVLLNWKPKP